jgi:hypothetical protein
MVLQEVSTHGLQLLKGRVRREGRHRHGLIAINIASIRRASMVFKVAQSYHSPYPRQASVMRLFLRDDGLSEG